MLRLSDVQIIPNNILYQKDHLLNIIQINIKQIVEFIKWVFNIFKFNYNNNTL